MATIFEALADPTRRHVLDRLRERPHMVGELADELHVSQPLMSKHLRVLRDAGLVQVRQDAQRRWYELRPEPLAELDDWLTPYRQLLQDRFDRLDAILRSVQQLNEQPTEQTHQLEEQSNEREK